MEYFERGKFSGSTVGKEWNIREFWIMLEKNQMEILHNKNLRK